MEVKIYDVIVVGAGPAGAAAAIVAADRGLSVVLLERGRYPRHKVCGEFVSAEAADVLRCVLRSQTILDGAPRITTSNLHAAGHSVSMHLNESAYSIPRVHLDECLWAEANARGIACLTAEATSIGRDGELFQISTAGHSISARAVINASGRWSRFSQPGKSEPWIGLKAHFEGDTDDAVDLYFAKNGYCGVQAVSRGVLNACALVKQGTAKQLEDVFRIDESLHRRSRDWKQVTETFASAPIYLGLRTPLRDDVLQVGDAAGFVDPFVGDGISLALRSGVLAGRTVLDRRPEEFAALYLKAFSAIFRNTARIRAALAASNSARPWLLHAVRIPALARRVFHSTRASRLDVLSPSLPRVN